MTNIVQFSDYKKFHPSTVDRIVKRARELSNPFNVGDTVRHKNYRWAGIVTAKEQEWCEVNVKMPDGKIMSAPIEAQYLVHAKQKAKK